VSALESDAFLDQLRMRAMELFAGAAEKFIEGERRCNPDLGRDRYNGAKSIGVTLGAVALDFDTPLAEFRNPLPRYSATEARSRPACYVNTMLEASKPATNSSLQRGKWSQ
jgi:hypothetical protein